MVVASDNGVPPLSSSAMINIDISDVNDNPPLFSQANYSLIIQVRRVKGGQCRWMIRGGEDENEVDGKRGGGAGETAVDTERGISRKKLSEAVRLECQEASRRMEKEQRYGPGRKKDNVGIERQRLHVKCKNADEGWRGKSRKE